MVMAEPIARGLVASVLAVVEREAARDGCRRVAVPLAVERWYDFHGFGCHLGNVDLFRKIAMKPGASWTFTIPAQSLCQGTKGELEVADQTSGETVIYKAGDRWDTDPGHKVTLSNKGTVDHEHLFYTMIVNK